MKPTGTSAPAERRGAAKRRVLFVNRSYWPDCEATGQLLTELCEDLAEQFEVEVICGQPNQNPDEQRYRRVGRELHNGVLIHRVPHLRFGKQFLIFRALNLISFVVSACVFAFFIRRPDVVITETDPFLLPIIGVMLKRARGIKLLTYLQDIYPDVAVAVGRVREGWLSGWLRRVLIRCYEASDRVIVVGKCMKSRLVAAGVSEQQIVVIPNWIDTQVVYPVKVGNQFRERHSLNGRFVVMHSGNIGLTQCLEQVIECAERIQHREDVVFVLVGNGAAKGSIERMVQRKKLLNVRFVPYQPRERLAESLSAADLHIVSMHPATTGCLVPSKLYGILATGTPVLAIAPETADASVLVKREKIGFSTQPFDADALDTVILWSADNRDHLAQMGRQGRQLIEKQFNRNFAVRQFQNLLSDVLQSDSRQRDGKTKNGSAIAERYSADVSLIRDSH